MKYTIQVTNHRGAFRRIPTAEAEASWQTVYDGNTTANEAREAVDELALWYRSVRVFRGRNVGRLHYAVLRP